MLIFKKVSDLQDHINTIKDQQTIGFVPTMGALHDGHASLIALSNKKCDVTICSIFVNPTQFDQEEDLKKYPRTTEQDIALLTQHDCAILFLPDVAEMYPDGTQSKRTYELGDSATILEGAYRDGHFEGVAQVVDLLLRITTPHYLFLGQKDLQQIAIVTRMCQSYHPDVTIITAPTIREDDGLARSSRNTRLNMMERTRAPIIYQCLVSIKTKKGVTPFSIVQKECIELLEDKGFKVDYVALVDRDNFTLLEEYDENKNMAALIAAYNGKVRLIDNMLL